MSDNTPSTKKSSLEILNCALGLAESIKSSEGRSAAMETLVGYFIRNDNVDRAAELANSVPEAVIRDRLLVRVIGKCVELDDDEYAYQLLEAIEDDRAIEAAKENFALTKAAKGDFEKAFELVKDLDHVHEALAGIAVQQAFRGDEAGAINTLERVNFYEARVRALLEIAAHHFENDRIAIAESFLDRARKDAQEIDFTDIKIEEGMTIAADYNLLKKYSTAVEVFEWVKEMVEQTDGAKKDTWLFNIAYGFMAAGNVERADETLDLVNDKCEIADCLVNFSELFLRDGEEEESADALEEAYAILNSQQEREVRDSKARFRVFANIAKQFAELNKNERAIEIAHGISSPPHRYFALTRIAQICTRKRNDSMAKIALQAIDEDTQRMTALVSVSDAKVLNEENEAALSVLREALSMADSVTQFTVRSEIYGEFISRFHKLGDEETARMIASRNLALITKIKGNENRSVDLGKLSQYYHDFNFQLTDADTAILNSLPHK